MLNTGPPIFINESFNAEKVTRDEMDLLLADGWRNFGTEFFRHNLALYENEIRRVLALRIRLADHALSKSQRRTIQKNQDLAVIMRPISITAEAEQLFIKHRTRFNESVPDSLYTFLSFWPESVPCEAKECAVYDGDTLIAVSYFNFGNVSSSGIYAMFDPEISGRRLGIFTMLKEIEYSANAGLTYYYPGYAYEGRSFYDYKKRFAALEYYDWESEWLDLIDDIT